MNLSTKSVVGLTLSLSASISGAPAAELILLPAFPGAYAQGVNANGTFVTGYAGAQCWYWTRDTGVVVIPELIGPGQGVGGQADASDTGKTMLANLLVDIDGVSKSEGCTYDVDLAELTSVGSFGSNCDIERSGAWAMNPDASIVVGLAWEAGCQARAYMWKDGVGITNLGTLYFFKPSRADAVSNLGETIAGYNDDYNGYRQAAMWRYTGTGATGYTQTNLVGPGSVKLKQATAVSGDGQWVGGFGRTSLDSAAPWRWNVTTGYSAMAPSPQPGVVGAVTDFNFDGTMALVTFGVQGGGSGYLWTEAGGYKLIEDVVAEHGLTIPPDMVAMGLPMGLSADEKVIVGTGMNSQGFQVPFILDLHESTPPCPADLDGDGIVGGTDLTVILSSWGFCPLGCQGDFDNDGAITGLDLSVILSGWGNCP